MLSPQHPRTEHLRRSRGAALVEMAVVTPMLILLVFGVIEATRMCMVAQLLTNAAREGCRVAVNNSTTSANVDARVKATLDASDTRIYPLITETLNYPNLSQARLNTPISLTLSVPFSSVDWLAPPFFCSSRTITATAVMLSQRP